MFTRTRFQQGSLTVKSRATGEKVWELRFYETNAQGQRVRRTVTVGALEEYPTESAARKSPIALAKMLGANSLTATTAATTPTFGALVARYELEEMPERYSTRASYASYLKTHIKPRWTDIPLDEVRPMPV